MLCAVLVRSGLMLMLMLRRLFGLCRGPRPAVPLTRKPGVGRRKKSGDWRRSDDGKPMNGT